MSGKRILRGQFPAQRLGTQVDQASTETLHGGCEKCQAGRGAAKSAARTEAARRVQHEGHCQACRSDRGGTEGAAWRALPSAGQRVQHGQHSHELGGGKTVSRPGGGHGKRMNESRIMARMRATRTRRDRERAGSGKRMSGTRVRGKRMRGRSWKAVEQSWAGVMARGWAEKRGWKAEKPLNGGQRAEVEREIGPEGSFSRSTSWDTALPSVQLGQRQHGGAARKSRKVQTERGAAKRAARAEAARRCGSEGTESPGRTRRCQACSSDRGCTKVRLGRHCQAQVGGCSMEGTAKRRSKGAAFQGTARHCPGMHNLLLV